MTRSLAQHASDLLQRRDMVRRAVTENRNVYALVDNRAEGNAPRTIQALVDSFEFSSVYASLFTPSEPSLTSV